MKFARCSSYCLIASLLIAGCSTSRLPVKNYKQPVQYTLIYLIHGDANYLYHNQKGVPLQADRQVLLEAKWVGRHAENGEVFIYHLKPETRILYIFPRKDRHFLYYRNGELVYEKKYSPHSKKKTFGSEAKLFHYFHQSMSKSGETKKIVLYFGHEIPVQKRTGYFRSRPNVQFSTALFAKGLSRFLQSKNERFDLIVLSTCDNGTPSMVRRLAPIAEYVLASPLNLHLSHMDTKALQLLDKPGGIKTEKVASAIATGTYNRLSSFLQTVISLALYEISELRNWLFKMAKKYKAYLKEQENLLPSTENIDCRNLSFFTPEKAAKGVKVWYRPSQFGQKTTNQGFSGWGCSR